MKFDKCPKKWNVYKLCASLGIHTSCLSSRKLQVEHNKLHLKPDILENIINIMKRKGENWGEIK